MPFALAAIAVLAIAGLAIERELRAERARAGAELQAVAALRGGQIDAWLASRLDQAHFLSTSEPLASLYAQGRAQAGQASIERLMARVVELRQESGSDAALLLDAEAKAVAREGGVPGAVAPELAQATRKALAEGRVEHTGLYHRAGSAIVSRLDVVAPLVHTGVPAQAAVVLRMDLRHTLLPILRSWPVPSASGRTRLYQREGERIVSLTVDGQAVPDLPLRTSPTALARVMRGEAAAGTPLRQPDRDGVDALSVVQPIAGTPWWLVAQRDEAEVEAPAWATARWIGALSAALLVALGAGLRWRSQREALRSAERELGNQREQLQGLELLAAIADHSADAIFAKDPQGRYLFYNRAAARQVGLEPQQVLGKTDDELFPPALAARFKANAALVTTSRTSRVVEAVIDLGNGQPIVSRATLGPLFDAAGRMSGLFGIAQDVT
ncbi:MAG: PAS domain-containing protein, partial [Burkholderiales bacterium]|nr:PAS domain-containing protein [Burkholderiales bacterium]